MSQSAFPLKIEPWCIDTDFPMHIRMKEPNELAPKDFQDEYHSCGGCRDRGRHVPVGIGSPRCGVFRCCRQRRDSGCATADGRRQGAGGKIRAVAPGITLVIPATAARPSLTFIRSAAGVLNLKAASPRFPLVKNATGFCHVAVVSALLALGAGLEGALMSRAWWGSWLPVCSTFQQES